MSLNIVIGVNADRFDAGMKQVEARLQAGGVKIRQFIPQVSLLGKTLDDLQQQIKGKQALLSTENDVRKIKILRSEITALQSEVVRVGNIGKAGFDQLGNAVVKANTPIAQAGVGLTKAFSVLRNISYVLPGIGIAGLLGALSGLVIGLFKAGEAFSSTDLLAAQFSNTLKEIGTSADDLKSKLDFENKIAGLKAQLAGLSGEDLSIFNLKKDIEASNTIKANADKNVASLERAKKGFEGYAKTVLAGGKVLDEFGKKEKGALVTLLQTFPDVTKIPEGLISKLSEKEQAGLTAYKDTLKELEKAKETSKLAGQVIDSATLQIGIETNAKTKRLLEKGKGDYEKYVSDMISLANQIKFVPFFGTFEENIFDTREGNFRNAKALVDAFYNSLSSNVKTKFGKPIQLPGSAFEFTPQSLVGQPVQKLFKDPVIIPIEFKFPPVDPVKAFKLQQVEKEFNQLFAGIAESSFSAFGETLGNLVSGVRDPFGPIIQLFSQFLTQIGKALIKYGVIKAGLDQILQNPLFLPGGVAIALGVLAIAAGSLLKNVSASGRATGGPMGAGMPYWVGENGRELVVPSTASRVIPNNSLGGIAGQANQMISIHLDGLIEGRNLRLIAARTERYQNTVS